MFVKVENRREGYVATFERPNEDSVVITKPIANFGDCFGAAIDFRNRVNERIKNIISRSRVEQYVVELSNSYNKEHVYNYPTEDAAGNIVIFRRK